MKRSAVFIVVGLLVLLALAVSGTAVQAATNCTFTTSGTTMTLTGNCTTDATIVVPNGFTLDGAGYTVTAVDPPAPAGYFLGAVVGNGGTEAHVKNLVITTQNLKNRCQAGANRLRGILFEGASGSITHNVVLNVNKGASGCQEGNGIEVRNAPYDGTHPATKAVEIAHNQVFSYQKTGIVANGDVGVDIQHNQIGSSATQANLAANSIQLGFGATGTVMHNNVDGNQWLGASNYAASGILIYLADNVNVSKNNVGGNSDVGVWASGNNGTYDNNRVFDAGNDGPHGDFGVVDEGIGNVFTNNKVRGFDEPYYGVTGGKNKVIPGPQSHD